MPAYDRLTEDEPGKLVLPQFSVRVVGPTGRPSDAVPVRVSPPLRIGADPQSCDLHVDDPAASGIHVEVVLMPDGRVRVLDRSRNGTYYGGAAIKEVAFSDSFSLRVGRTSRVEITARGPRQTVQPLWPEGGFGDAVGDSIPMRILFYDAYYLAQSDASIMLIGDNGGGKTSLAREIHRFSQRSGGPFREVRCGELGKLAESKLFGHEKGAFTDAKNRLRGFFELANGGTMLLDDVQRLPTDVQDVLHRTLESLTIQPLGSEEPKKLDVRLIYTSTESLKALWADGRLNRDLYWRLEAAVPVVVPPLRERSADIPLLIAAYLAKKDLTPADFPEEAVEMAQAYHWPGNVRQLYGWMDRVVGLPHKELRLPTEAIETASDDDLIDVRNVMDLGYDEAQAEIVSRFDRRYLAEHFERSHGCFTSMAERIRKSRKFVHDRDNLHNFSGRIRGPRARRHSHESKS